MGAGRERLVDRARRPARSPLGSCSLPRSPVDRGKPGSKLHLVCDGRGLPLTVAVTAATVPDVVMLAAVVDDIPPVRTRSGRGRVRPAKLDADKGYGQPRLVAAAWDQAADRPAWDRVVDPVGVPSLAGGADAVVAEAAGGGWPSAGTGELLAACRPGGIDHRPELRPIHGRSSAPSEAFVACKDPPCPRQHNLDVGRPVDQDLPWQPGCLEASDHNAGPVSATTKPYRRLTVTFDELALVI
jgi:Transposase DDE domain